VTHQLSLVQDLALVLSVAGFQELEAPFPMQALVLAEANQQLEDLVAEASAPEALEGKEVPLVLSAWQVSRDWASMATCPARCGMVALDKCPV